MNKEELKIFISKAGSNPISRQINYKRLLKRFKLMEPIAIVKVFIEYIKTLTKHQQNYILNYKNMIHFNELGGVITLNTKPYEVTISMLSNKYSYIKYKGTAYSTAYGHMDSLINAVLEGTNFRTTISKFITQITHILKSYKAPEEKSESSIYEYMRGIISKGVFNMKEIESTYGILRFIQSTYFMYKEVDPDERITYVIKEGELQCAIFHLDGVQISFRYDTNMAIISTEQILFEHAIGKTNKQTKGSNTNLIYMETLAKVYECLYDNYYGNLH